MADRYSLMIHGGAGELDNENDNARVFLESIELILERGREILLNNGSALDTVEQCATLLEDNPLFNAGRGSVFTGNGLVENDAAIMDGRRCGAGAVAAVSGIANPVQLARRVMDDGRHVLLTGNGASDFARQEGFTHMDQSYFHTDTRWRELEQYRQQHHGRHPGSISPGNKYPAGTIGAVARDMNGNLAAATSTGGITGKHPGRIGDSPLPGAGVYADNATCAVSATGRGEDFMRCVLAKYIADLVELQQLDAADAVIKSMDYLQQKVDGRGGVIVIDRQGYCAAGWNSRTLIHGWIEHGGKSHSQYN